MRLKEEGFIVAKSRMRESALGLPDEFNIAEELLDRHARDSPNSVAVSLVSQETLKINRDITYFELEKMTSQVGNALVDGGVQPEQRIAIMLNDGLEFVSSFLGALKLGAVPILFSTYLSEEHLLFLLNDSRAKTLIIEQELVPKLSNIRPHLRYTKEVVSTKEVGDVISYHDFVRDKSDRMETMKTSKNDVAFWFFTSGSTGFPKGVVHLHHDLYHAGLTYYDNVLHVRKEDRLFSGAKLYFSAGLGFGLYGPLLMGASTILHPGKSTAQNVLEIMKNARPTAFLGVPTLYAQMLQLIDEQARDISSVRIFATGGEPLSTHVFKEWKSRLGIEITEAIGAAEVCHHYISNVLGEARSDTCGRLMEGYEAKIVDEAGKELEPNQIGKLMVKGESTFVYYWHLHEETKRALVGEWVNTGDLFYLDEEGYYHFCGRTDFSFKIHGLWVSPIEIENAVLETGLVSECCVVSIEGGDGISKPIAYLVPKDSKFTSEDLTIRVESLLSKKLGKYKLPKKYVMISSIEKTTVGKIDRSAILNRARRDVKL